MLRQCADALARSLRAVDDLARTGPDEFSVLLHATDARSATAGRAASRTPWRARPRSTPPRH